MGNPPDLIGAIAAMVGRRLLLSIYVAVIAVEVAILSWIFAFDPPAPSDPLSVYLGWAGLVSMIVMLIYVLARRSKTMRRFMPLSAWLNFHIFLGVQGVLFAFFHSIHIFWRAWPTHWANPGITSGWAVVIVFFSGIFGRYLYGMLPKSGVGERMALAEAQAELRAMATRLPADAAELLKKSPRPTSFSGIVRADLDARRSLRALRRFGLDDDVMQVAERRIYLERRLAMVDGVHRFFGWWIVLHRPLSAIMYILSVVHVVLAYMFTPSLATP